jgi:glycosyltransferase involved in cell wall biosynthesis
MARRSPLLGQCRIERIPNGLDIDRFAPADRRVAAAALGLEPGLLRVLFVAHGLDDNPRKGGQALMHALRSLKGSSGIELVLVGHGGESWEKAGPIQVRQLGYVTDDARMADAYRAADLIVVPSVVENLPNTVLEAMACGTPAVAFDVGGMKDAVKHGETGYLAQPGNIEDLGHGITLALGSAQLRERWGRASRALVEAEFSKDRQAKSFLSLYQEILESRRLSRSG